MSGDRLGTHWNDRPSRFGKHIHVYIHAKIHTNGGGINYASKEKETNNNGSVSIDASLIDKSTMEKLDTFILLVVSR